MSGFIVLAIWLFLCALCGLLGQRKGYRSSHFAVALALSIGAVAAQFLWVAWQARRVPADAHLIALLFAVPLAHLLFLAVRQPQVDPERAQRVEAAPVRLADALVRCDSCAEWIQPLAKKCRFCGAVRELDLRHIGGRA